MYTFSQLLLRNISLAIFFIISISTVSTIMLSSLLESKADKHTQIITALTQQIELTNNEQQTANNLLNQLKEISNYNSLTIYNLTGNKLSDFKNTNTSLIIPFVTPEIKQVTFDDFPLKINYQLNFQGELTLVLVIIVISTIVSLLLVVFAVAMSTKRHKAMFDIISQQIKNDFALINNTTVDNKKETIPDSKLLEIPELQQGIADIKLLMAQQLESVTHLEQAAYVDHLTKLDNRSRFVQFYDNQIRQDSPVKFGVLSITRCSELQTINQIHGYKEGDSYIAQVANLLKRALSPYPDGRLFRLNSSDFACILPNIKLKEAEIFTTELTALFNAYQLSSELESVAYTGLVSFDKSKPLGELLALVDTSVSIAQTQAPNSWYSQTDTDILQKNSANYGNQNWRQEIDSVIENRRVTLLVQPIQPSGRNSKVYGEVLARFLNSNEDMLPTSSFLAMAEKLDKITAIDKLIIETTIDVINQKNMHDHSFGINLNARSISDEHFIVWLERKLLRESKVARILVFEITEYGLQQNIKTSKRLIDMLHRVGSKVTVERFGVGLTSFKFFRDLTPDYIKMDSSYTRDIDDDKNNQYFLRLMVDLAHRLSINVLAESVESQEEKHTLEKLLIDGCQGFYIGKPKTL
ncbi:EAL domain-containing protein [Colwellia sp. 20A7]|uniref:EAL domain-containing protein n=1 Tax=Colwellia sp. 20A7 TaxID=2689569 RepID=UPI00135BADF8|nr:GGDEF domain-containing protein [Colwellia sp. 20A7]